MPPRPAAPSPVGGGPLRQDPAAGGPPLPSPSADRVRAAPPLSHCSLSLPVADRPRAGRQRRRPPRPLGKERREARRPCGGAAAGTARARGGRAEELQPARREARRGGAALRGGAAPVPAAVAEAGDDLDRDSSASTSASRALPLRQRTAPSYSQWRRGSSGGGRRPPLVLLCSDAAHLPHLRRSSSFLPHRGRASLPSLLLPSQRAREGRLECDVCAVKVRLRWECRESAITLSYRRRCRAALQRIFTLPAFTASRAVERCGWSNVPWPLRFLILLPRIRPVPPPSEPAAGVLFGQWAEAMQHEPWRPGAEFTGVGAPTTVDEASMERSKSFVKALQELKNLRPQLYSASEYCEKSYLHSEQKQMVLDNLKDYAVRALVNAVDHLGTVAYKLTDLYEQQASEISTLELKVASLNQQVLTCQTYTDKEGLRQQQMTGGARRHHKHYIIPYAGNKRMQAFSEMQGNTDFDSTPRPYSAAKTLQWHLVSEKNSKSNRPDQSEFTPGETKTTKPSSSGFRLLGKESSASPLSKHVQSNTSLDIVSVGMKDQPATRHLSSFSSGNPRHLSSFSSFDNPRGRQIQKAPLRTKSMLAAFFVKHRSGKMKNVSVR